MIQRPDVFLELAALGDEASCSRTSEWHPDRQAHGGHALPTGLSMHKPAVEEVVSAGPTFVGPASDTTVRDISLDALATPPRPRPAQTLTAWSGGKGMRRLR